MLNDFNKTYCFYKQRLFLAKKMTEFYGQIIPETVKPLNAGCALINGVCCILADAICIMVSRFMLNYDFCDAL